MLIGLGIPTCREGVAYPSGFADLNVTLQLAQTAEQLGFAALWANDHYTTPKVVMETLAQPPNFYEPVVTFAFLAPQVPRLHFVLATLVTPLREPVLLAKQIATLDQATGGRVVLGLGIGAYPEEYRAIARPAGKPNRGHILDESIAALRTLFEETRSQYSGRYVGFDEIEVFPKPAQARLPIYLSGNSPEGVARASRIGDGWILASASPARASESIARMRSLATEGGRSADAVSACVQAWVSIGPTEDEALRRLRESQHFQRLQALQPDKSPQDLADEFRQVNLLGTPDHIRSRLAEYERAGVDHMGLVFLAADPGDLIAAVELFGTEVLSQATPVPS
jgi:probable F420-dependent oxidoreductase